MSNNILFIMADQLTPFMMGTYGCEGVKTPNLDKLAQMGVLFDNAYSPCPLCSPARAALMTGQYVSNIGTYDNGIIFTSDKPTFAHYLTEKGYDTVLSGKMHFIGPDQLHGFTKRLTTDIYPARPVWTSSFRAIHDGTEREMGRGFASNYSFDEKKQNKKPYGIAPNTHFMSYDEETQMRALQFLRDAAIKNKPFFLEVSFHHPHEPFFITKEMWEEYKDVELPMPNFPENLDETYSAMDKWLGYFHGTDKFNVRKKENILEVRRCYAALASYVDRKVGELIQELESTGLAKNTVIVFTSDHGDMLCEKGMIQKRCFYEWSSRVPLIMKFPDNNYKGSVNHTPVSLLDLAPTFAEIAGAEIQFPIDGKSLFEFIENQNLQREVFSESHAEGVEAPCFMLRKGDFKYIYIHGENSQLFNLKNDPSENVNLIDNPLYKDVADKMTGIILEKFNVEEIERDLIERIKRAYFIQKSTRHTGVSWDYFPYFDESSRFVRTMD